MRTHKFNFAFKFSQPQTFYFRKKNFTARIRFFDKLKFSGARMCFQLDLLNATTLRVFHSGF